MRTNKWVTIGAAALSLAALLSACSGNGNSSSGTTGKEQADSGATKTAEKPPEPFELKIHALGVSDDELNSRFRAVLQKKFPHIKITWLPSSGPGNSLPEYVARGEVPDIIRNISSTIQANYINLGLAYDMRELVKKYKYDLSRFNPIFVDGFISLSAQNGELYGLPVSPFFSRVLYYNKDLFDKFGQPYLKDGMNWDQVYEAAKKLTRVEGGVNYRGLSANIATFLTYNEYSLPTLDPNKDALSSPETWQKVFTNYMRFFQIPNNSVQPTINEETGVFQKGAVAIHADIFSPYFDLSKVNNWDMVSTPIIDGAPKKIGIFPPGYLLITNQSKHKEEAFQVIMEMLNDEVQLADAKNGFLPTLANKDMMKVLGQSSDKYKGKNMNAVGYYEFAPLRPVRAKGMTVIDTSAADTKLREAFFSVAQGKEDTNTALRRVDEQLRKDVEAEKSKTK